MAVQDLDRIEAKLDRAVAAAVPVSDNVGGVMFSSMAEVMEFAKLMSLAQTAVPKHLRGNPGACLAITIQALEWRSSPFAVANKSYEVNDRIAYEAQLIHAVIEARAPLKERLRFEFIGEGPDRQCKVIGHFKGEATPVDLTTPKQRDIKVQNSPLWKSDPDQQFCYYGARNFARRFCPDVLLGIYSADELEENGGPKDITPETPSLKDRLGGKKGRGFSEDGVTKALAHTPGQTLDTSHAKQPVPVTIEAEAVEEKQLALNGDAETELETKKRAVENAETKADLAAIVQATTDYLKSVNRTDLLNDFLSAAAAREKKLKA